MKILATLADWLARRAHAGWVRKAMRRIEAERRRQIDEEYHSPGHDDGYQRGELLDAALCYFGQGHSPGFLPSQLRGDGTPYLWPWLARWWKPKGPIRDLERAGALCLAEIDRRGRAGLSANGARKLLEQCAERLAIELSCAQAEAEAARLALLEPPLW